MLKETEEKNLTAIVEAAVKKHGTHPDAFIPILLDINHNYGYIPAEAIRLARAKLHQPQEHSLVSEGQLYELASFYHMLSTEKNGRHVVQFCASAPCHVQGGRELWKAIQETLQLKSGQTDPQGRFTLKTVSCIGICGVGPVMLVDDDSFGNVTPEDLPNIFARYE
ncbi:MAG: NAD(P)H-dependent oxidoreductase subunit E [Anaerolineales bacterium]|jgi:NADH:ubiquinone oxidoreductase subunit E